MIPWIIGLNGELEAGKDTAADYLGQKFGYVKISPSDALKDDLVLTMDYGIDLPAMEKMPEEHLDTILRHRGKGYRNWEKPALPDIRSLQQYYGTEHCRRLFGEDYWVKRMHDRIKGVESTMLQLGLQPAVVIPSVRFLNEGAYVKRRSGINIRINRPTPKTDPKASLHISERVPVPVDSTVDNSKDPEHMFQQLRAILQLAKFDESQLRKAA